MDLPNLGCPSMSPTATLTVTVSLVVALVIVGVRQITLCLSIPLVDSDPVRQVDAIVVLGSGSHSDRTLTPESAYRLLHAVQLFKEGHASMLILSGGSHQDSHLSDAEVMGNVASALGVQSGSLILDSTPSTTAAQAASIAAIAKQHGISSIVLVTSPLHSYRAARAFRRLGLTVVSAPGIPDSRLVPSTIFVAQDHLLGQLNVLNRALYEYVAIGFYWWRRLI
jgi:uncharacterized SAM-binding protein YcdF (DUF218 family)